MEDWLSQWQKSFHEKLYIMDVNDVINTKISGEIVQIVREEFPEIFSALDSSGYIHGFESDDKLKRLIDNEKDPEKREWYQALKTVFTDLSHVTRAFHWNEEPKPEPLLKYRITRSITRHGIEDVLTVEGREYFCSLASLEEQEIWKAYWRYHSDEKA